MEEKDIRVENLIKKKNRRRRKAAQRAEAAGCKNSQESLFKSVHEICNEALSHIVKETVSCVLPQNENLETCVEESKFQSGKNIHTSINMSAKAEQSREEVLATRQGKKKNKGAKTKPKENEVAEVTVNTPSQQDSSGAKVELVKEAASSSECPVKNERLEKVKKVDAKEVPSEGKSNEKSREEILAEREMKRIKKLAGKAMGKTEPKGEANVAKKEIKSEDVNSESSKGDSQDVEKVTESISKLKVEGKANDMTEKLKLEETEGKSKAQLKAERRAKQEAQRAKKLEGTTKPEIIKTEPTQKARKPVKEQTAIKEGPPASKVVSHRVKLFAHLYTGSQATAEKGLVVNVHPSIVRLGTQYRTNVVSGSNVRCLALLSALQKVIADFATPPNQEFSRGLEAELSKSMAYLHKRRPVAVSMVNAARHLRFQVNQTSGKEGEKACKKQLRAWIETYIKEQLEKAAEAISISVRGKIAVGDVILTYGCSSLIQRILVSAHKEGVRFRVVVVDSRPWLEGREMLRRLVTVGINCTYVFVNGMSFIMPEVSKVLLGAHALLSNGYVMSRAGSSQVALLARALNVPVLVCCETHKFSERVQTDSFVYNELGDPDELVLAKGSGSKVLSQWKSLPHLTPLNLTYDVTPPDLVSAVVTEVAVLPCTSVPVILRIKPNEMSA